MGLVIPTSRLQPNQTHGVTLGRTLVPRRVVSIQTLVLNGRQ
jgi:hypothetical protein